MGSFFSGILLGFAVVYADALITIGMFGFENPYLLIGLCFVWIMALIGMFSSGNKARIVATMLGLPLGVIAANAIRVNFFGQDSILAGIGF